MIIRQIFKHNLVSFINNMILIKNAEMFGYLEIHILKIGSMNQMIWLYNVFNMIGKWLKLMIIFKIKRINKNLLYLFKEFIKNLKILINIFLVLCLNKINFI